MTGPLLLFLDYTSATEPLFAAGESLRDTALPGDTLPVCSLQPRDTAVSQMGQRV